VFGPIAAAKMYKKIVGVQGDALKNTEAKRLAKKNNNLTHTHT